MILSGRITDWSVADLLQILRITQKTATLEIRGPDRSATLFFCRGRIVDAEPVGSAVPDAPRERVVETVYQLMLFPDGVFSVGQWEPGEDTEGFDVGEIVEQATQYVEAENTLRQAGLIGEHAFELAKTAGSVTLSADVWRSFTRVVGVVSFPQLERMLGRHGAVRFLEHLHKLGLLESRPSPSIIEEEIVSRSPVEEAPVAGAEEEGEIEPSRRQMREVIAPVNTTLVPSVLEDIRSLRSKLPR